MIPTNLSFFVYGLIRNCQNNFAKRLINSLFSLVTILENRNLLKTRI